MDGRDRARAFVRAAGRGRTGARVRGGIIKSRETVAERDGVRKGYLWRPNGNYWFWEFFGGVDIFGAGTKQAGARPLFSVPLSTHTAMILDTGSNGIMVPSDIFDDFVQALLKPTTAAEENHQGECLAEVFATGLFTGGGLQLPCPCSDIKFAANIQFVLPDRGADESSSPRSGSTHHPEDAGVRRKTLTLTPYDYFQTAPDWRRPTEADVADPHKKCFVRIVPFEGKEFILGDIFLQNFAVIHDWKNMRLGFVNPNRM